MIKQYLDELENRIDLQVENDLFDQWRMFLGKKCPTPIFRPERQRAAAPQIEWPKILVNDAVKNLELMLLREMAQNSAVIADGHGQLLNARCNYGTGIMPSLFGAELFFLDDQHDTLPTTHPLADGTDGIRRLLDAGVPDLNNGWGAKVFETAAYYRDTLKDYPKLSSTVYIYHPDLQGPADIAEMIWGCDIFMEYYDNPELVKSFLELITETYIQFMNRWEKEVSTRRDFRAHWNWGHLGKVVVRDDSAMNLSPELYQEFALPFDRKILETFGGGVVHFCGRGDHYIEYLCEIPGLNGIQMSQPEMNDMAKIYHHTIDRGIPLLSFRRSAAEEALKNGIDLKGLVHCN